MIKKMFPYIKGYGVSSILASVTVVIEVFLEVYIPYLMADIVNIGIETQDVAFITKRGILMILMACASLIMGIFSARFAVNASTGFAKNLRGELFARVQGFSFANVDKFSTASLITRLTTDITNVQQSFQMIVRGLVRAPIMLVAATIMAVRINGSLATIFAVAIPLLAGSLVFIALKTYPRFKAMFKKFDNMNATVQENLTAVRVVKAFVREDYEEDKFYKASKAVKDAQIKAERIIIWNMPIAQYILYLCMIAVCYLGGRMVVSGNLLSGDLMSFISYIAQVLSSLIMLSMMFIMLIMSRASIQRISEVLDEKNDINDSQADATGITVQNGAITFENVSFSYSKNEDNLTLENINLHIESGETVGIIGGTGSAKTTLVQLIPRLYDVLSGSVKVGGVDVRKYKLEVLRQSVSMVLQKNVLFSGTIKENLLWGDLNATDEQIEAACQAASAHKFITSFPDGYQSMLGQSGVNVSGGQKQRLCIARALLKQPKIIILDDSTSAVDTATDASIRRALKEELCGTTKIIIAQRITSVMDADKIIVLNEGKINAIGTHETLLANNEIYREVYQSQQKGVE